MYVCVTKVSVQHGEVEDLKKDIKNQDTSCPTVGSYIPPSCSESLDSGNGTEGTTPSPGLYRVFFGLYWVRMDERSGSYMRKKAAADRTRLTNNA